MWGGTLTVRCRERISVGRYWWERAAVVYAFTTTEVKGGPRTARRAVQLPIREFADLGIKGLTTRDTVRPSPEASQHDQG
jgi:hypothetical protein